MVKRKGRFDSEAHFVAPLSIEECTHRLSLLVAEDVRIEIESFSSDRVQFAARLYERGRLRVVGQGVLLRWEGTLTRVACKVQMHEGVLVWALVVMLLLAIGMLAIPFLAFVAAGYDATTWAIVAGLGMVCIIMLLAIANRLAPPDDTPANLLRIVENALR